MTGHTGELIHHGNTVYHLDGTRHTVAGADITTGTTTTFNADAASKFQLCPEAIDQTINGTDGTKKLTIGTTFAGEKAQQKQQTEIDQTHGGE
jgi:hypothetical protein